MTGAWLEVLDISGVPVEQYGSCYAAAMQARAQRKADGEQLSHLTADELAAEWLKIKRFNDEMRVEEMKHRALAEVNPKSCERCFGTVLEELPGRPARPGCEHKPLTADERLERDREKAEQLKSVREEMKRIGRPKPVAIDRPKPPAGHWLKCDKCPNRVNVLHVTEGQRCGYLLNRYASDEGEPTICKGTLQPE